MANVTKKLCIQEQINISNQNILNVGSDQENSRKISKNIEVEQIRINKVKLNAPNQSIIIAQSIENTRVNNELSSMANVTTKLGIQEQVNFSNQSNSNVISDQENSRKISNSEVEQICINKV